MTKNIVTFKSVLRIILPHINLSVFLEIIEFFYEHLVADIYPIDPGDKKSNLISLSCRIYR